MRRVPRDGWREVAGPGGARGGALKSWAGDRAAPGPASGFGNAQLRGIFARDRTEKGPRQARAPNQVMQSKVLHIKSVADYSAGSYSGMDFSSSSAMAR